MELNKKQIELIKALESQVQIWKKTNDIKSPSHYNLIDEELFKLEMDDILSEKQSEEINRILVLLYHSVKTLK